MYSPNVPVPGRVAHLTSDLFPYLAPFDRVRDRHTFVCKRSEDVDLDRPREQLRRTLAGQSALEARATNVQFFEEPPRGVAPVVYLTVDGPGLLGLHRTPTDGFSAIEEIRGDDYVPHATFTRGGSVVDARAVVSQPFDPIK